MGNLYLYDSCLIDDLPISIRQVATDAGMAFPLSLKSGFGDRFSRPEMAPQRRRRLCSCSWFGPYSAASFDAER